jgi:F0F1-type ATP synthase membrane subunit b/b'
MNISTADYIFLLIAVGLMVVMFFLYRRTRKAMKANIREILEEYKELKQMASELKKDTKKHKEEEGEALDNPETPKKEIDDYKDYQLREYIYEVRQKNKADIERAIKKLKEEITNDVEQKLSQAQVKTKAVAPKAKEKSKDTKKPKEETVVKMDLNLSDEHLNILYNLAEETEEVALGVLYENYKKVFPDKERKEFQVIVRELLENNMIRESYAAAGDFFFTVTNEGLVYIRKKM